MNQFSFRKIGIALLAGCFLAVGAHTVSAGQSETEPTTLMYRIAITGSFVGFDSENGRMLFDVSGPVDAPLLSPGGLVKDLPRPPIGVFTSRLSIDPFNFSAPPPVVRWSCGDCTLSLSDGSLFHTYNPIPMEGRALFLLGPVLESAAHQENPNVATIRMAGCGGIVGAAGPFAGQVGTLCANGIFSFDPSNPSTMTGESHCSITLHTPVQ